MRILDKAVIKDGEKYLVILREPNTKFFPNQWDFAGGKRRKNETPEEAVIREVKEETNLDVKPKLVVGEYERTEHDEDLIFTVHEVNVLDGEIKLSQDHTEFAWKTKEELLEMKITPVVRMFFEDQ